MIKYLLGIVAILFIGGGAWLYLQPKDTMPAAITTVAVAPGEKPWVEVSMALVTAIDAKGATTTLQTGDEVRVGSVIATNAAGVVLIHFADGSFAKLDPNSSVTITQADYDTASGATNVHLTLSAGTLWSKVLDLVGIGSSWKVETSNAVATVRGTSFMTSVLKGKTKVVGIEHTVTVAPLKPDTHEPIGTEVSVTVDAQVTVDDTHITALASGKEKLATTTLSADIPASSSYKEFKTKEKQFDTLRDSLKEKTTNDTEFRKEFREAQVKELKETIIEKRTEPAPRETVSSTTTPKDTRIENKIKIDTKVDTKPVVQTDGGSTFASDARPVSLSVTTDSSLGNVIEKDTVHFHATLLFSDGSKKDVTDSVKWNVINHIGVFPTPGNFLAQLSPDDAELGEVPGAVYATFKGEGGKELNAASTQFTVHAYVPLETDMRG